jgi:hypothetical protein
VKVGLFAFCLLKKAQVSAQLLREAYFFPGCVGAADLYTSYPRVLAMLYQANLLCCCGC